MIDIDKYIKDAMRSKDDRLEIYRGVKKNFIDWQTSEKGCVIYKANGNTIPENIQLEIIGKMVKACQKAKAEFEIAKRYDLALNEDNEINVLMEFLPKQASEEDVIELLTSMEIEKSPKSMGAAMKAVRAKFPSMDGKVVSEIVKKYLNN